VPDEELSYTFELSNNDPIASKQSTSLHTSHCSCRQYCVPPECSFQGAKVGLMPYFKKRRVYLMPLAKREPCLGIGELSKRLDVH
jgi:hypothetical protein